jgi:anti-sigma factor RsiW
MPAALEQLAHVPRSAPVPIAADLQCFLAAVPDPRDPRGLRYPLSALLASAAAAVLAGARSLTAIGEGCSSSEVKVVDQAVSLYVARSELG